MTDSLSVSSVIGHNPQEFCAYFGTSTGTGGHHLWNFWSKKVCPRHRDPLYVLFCKNHDLENEQIPVLPKHSKPLAFIKVTNSQW